MSLFAKMKGKTTFSAPVFIPSFIFIAVTAAVCIAFPKWAEDVLGRLKNYAFSNFSWFYVLVVSLFILFLLLLALSRYGDIRLGGDDEEAEFPFFSWVAMLFAAGMGVGLMFFGAAEPLMHSVSDITEGASQQKAMLFTFYHWGIHAWAIYGVIALSLAYFGFRYRLPLSLRSTFYPILKDKINGPIGHTIDAFALTATIFGIITTLGYGASQLDAGLQHIGLFSYDGFASKVVIIFVVISIAILSAISGVGRGVRRLSEINLGLAISLMAFILLTGSTIYLLSAFSENIGYYLSSVVRLSFKTFAYDGTHTGWFTGWTVLYWAWWFSWAPFVGLFIARISRGRTIREFIFGVLLIPTVFNLLWFTIFGNSALLTDAASNGALAAMTGSPENLLFAFLDYFPLSSVTSFFAVIILALFFITSADSGIFVLNNIASSGRAVNMPRWQSVLWGGIMIVLAIALLNSGGLGAVQAMTLVVALPFAIIMVMMCFSLIRGLQVDSEYSSTRLSEGGVSWSGSNWKERLKQILTQTQEDDIEKFIHKVVRPALNLIRTELAEEHGLKVKVDESRGAERTIQLSIEKGEMRNFVYGVCIKSKDASQAMLDDEHIPSAQHKIIYVPMTYFGDGRSGYDVQYMSRDELIADVLKQYQRYLVLLNSDKHALMTQAPLEED